MIPDKCAIKHGENIEIQAIDADHFYWTEKRKDGTFDKVLIDLNQFQTQHKNVSGKSHAFYESMSDLTFWARKLNAGKPTSSLRIYVALLKLHNAGVNTGIRFGPRW